MAENWDDKSDDTQPMSSLETHALLAQLESEALERVFTLPSVINKLDLSLNGGTQDFDTLWDNPHYVKFPCSSRNTYRLRTDPTNYLSKWQLICTSLASEMSSSRDLENCILSYSPSFVGQWTFGSLHDFCAEIPPETTFWSVTLPFIARLAQNIEHLFSSPIPLLRSQISAELTFSHEQCASLIANMFFCTFPQRSCNSPHAGHGTGAYENFPNVNFNTLYATNENVKRPNRRVQKLQCLVYYFETLAKEGIPSGKVSFRRSYIDDEPEAPLSLSVSVSSPKLGSITVGVSGSGVSTTTGAVKSPQWTLSTSPLLQPDLRVQGTIEDDGNSCWQADFANMMIGGGVIGAGCVQEEIRFVINPECLVSRLICEKMSPNEAVLIIGPQRYSKYSGYRDTFAWSGHYDDSKAKRDSKGRIMTYITAIDAVSFPAMQAHRQFSRHYVHRELNKAYVGFMPSYDDLEISSLASSATPSSSAFSVSASPSTTIKREDSTAKWPIATGHWGCGAFNGDKHLKAIVQWMAASEAGRTLRYFAFGDEQFNQRFNDVVIRCLALKLSVGDLMQYTLSYRPGPKRNLFAWILHCLSKIRK